MNLFKAAQGYFDAKHIAAANVPAFRGSLRYQIACAIVISLLCAGMIGCCQPNDPSCRNFSFGPSGAEVAGVAIGVGAGVATVIALEVHHAHHTLSGCVAEDSDGKQLKTHSGNKLYLLSGSTANIAAGRRVSLHGTRAKEHKHDTAEQSFSVERLVKDYGPC